MEKYLFAKNINTRTKEFQLSEELLDLRYELGLTFEETAEILGKSKREYLDYECGEDTVSIDDYKKAIKKLKRKKRG